mgnify:CR=1 FL=1
MLSLIIPVYRNEGSLPDLLQAVADLNTELHGAFEAVFVVDGSPDRCYEILRERLPLCPMRSRLVLLARNFGAFAAIRSGLEIASGDRFAVMAADLQEPPELVLRMNDALQQGDCDVVVGVREARADPWSTRWSSGLFWWLYRRYVVPDIPPGGVDVFACNRPFRDTLLQLGESHSSLIAQIFWLGFRRRLLPYVPGEKARGLVESVGKGSATLGEGFRFAIGLFAHPSRGGLAVLGAAGFWAASIGVLWASFHAFGVHVPLAVVVQGFFLGMVANLFPLAPAGVGAVDAGMIGAFVLFGIPEETVFPAILIFRLVAFWMPIPPGIVAFFQLRKTVHRWEDEGLPIDRGEGATSEYEPAVG